MTSATIKETRIPQPPIMQPVPQPDKVVRTVVLEMSEDEAKTVRLILGKRACGSNGGVVDTGRIYEAISALGLDTDYKWEYRVETTCAGSSWKFVRRGS